MNASIVMVSILLVSILVTFLVSKIVLKRIKKVKTEPQQTELFDSDKKKMAELFVSAEEKYISSLGNGYFLNFLSDGAIKKAFAFISDKRVYFRGNCYTGRGKALLISEENRTVDIKDVTGTGFIYKRRIGVLAGIFAALLIPLGGLVGSLYHVFDRSYWPGQVVGWGLIGAVCLPLFISCLIVFINYLKKRKTFFQVQYAGGSIAFDVSYYAKAEIEDFQKQLRRVKDLIEEASAKSVSAPVTVQSQPVAGNNGTTDELRKYADLLKDGLISQEDYDAMKKKLLGL